MILEPHDASSLVAVDRAARLGQRALLLSAASFGLVVLVGLMGPSAVAVALPQRVAWHPPFWLTLQPSPWLVVGLVLVAIGSGALGVHLALRALAAGWRPAIGRLVGFGVGGVSAVALVPPMSSGDVLMYAAYGRVAALGYSPYVSSPADVLRLGYDPVMSATELPWQGTTSVYGPIATWLQQAASQASGASTHTTVMWLHLLNAAAFIVVGLLALFLAGPEPRARARAVLLVLANPVLIWAVVAGSHNDAQAVAFAVSALVVARRSPFAGGLLLGLGVAVKLDVALFGLAMLWGMRRSGRGIAELCAGTLLALIGTYGVFGLQAVDQLRSASKFVSTGSQWRLVLEPLNGQAPESTARTIVLIAAPVLMVLMAILLGSVLPRPLLPPRGAKDPTPDAVRAAAVLSLAWLVTAPYVLPWYALVVWVPLAALAASGADRILLAWTASVSAAYVAGRVIELPSALQSLKAHTIEQVLPVVQAVLLVLLVVWCLRHRRARPEEDDEQQGEHDHPPPNSEQHGHLGQAPVVVKRPVVVPAEEAEVQAGVEGEISGPPRPANLQQGEERQQPQSELRRVGLVD